MPQAYLPKQSERNMQIATLQQLCYLPDTFAWEMDTKATAWEGKDGALHFLATMSRGKADVAGLKAIFGFVMELKKPGEKLKLHQKAWRDAYLEKTHGWYFVIRNTDQAHEAWKEVGVTCFCGRKMVFKDGDPTGMEASAIIYAVCQECNQSYGRCACPPLPGRINWKE